MRLKKLFEQTFFASLIAVLLYLGYWQGVQTLSFMEFSILESHYSLIGFTAFLAVSTVLFLGWFARKEEIKSFDGKITALVPVYHDSDVMGNSVESLLNSTHEDLEVDIIAEPEDVESISTAEEYAEKYDRVKAMVNEAGNSKASAVNYAVEESDSEVFALFDADQEVDKDFLAITAGYLDEADIVQGRFVPDTKGFLESLSYYEYQLFGHCFRQLIFLLTDFRMAASKSVVFTREAFEEVDGYDPDMVTEDYDFAQRCYRSDLDVKMVHNEVTREEAVHSFRDWWGQRKRWMIGNIQVLEKMVRQLPRNLKERRLYIGILFTLGSIAGSLFLVTLLPKFVIAAANKRYDLVLAPLLLIYAASLPPRVKDYRRGKADRIGWEWLLVPFTLPVFSLITIKATIEYFVSWEGEWFSVEKKG